MKKEIVNCLTWMMNYVAETLLYTWDDKQKIDHTEEASKKFYEELKKHIDLSNITEQEAQELRFRGWSDEIPNLYLFPLWLVPIIPDGFIVYNLDGEPFEYDSATADNDIRFGCVAYGIKVRK